MARRTRRFESLEERRLLAAASNAPDAAAMVAAPLWSPAVVSPTAPGAANDSSPNSTAGYAEYGAASSADPSYAVSGKTYGSYSEYPLRPTSGDSTEYGQPTTSRPSTSTTPSADSLNQSSQAAVLQFSATTPTATPSTDTRAAVLSLGAAVAIATAGAPGGPVDFDPHNLVARGDLEEPASGGPAPAVLERAASELLAPVAWATSGHRGDFNAVDADIDAPTAIADVSSPTGSSSTAGLIAGAVGADWSYFERGVDELLERLARYGDDLPEATTAWHIGECVGLAAGAAAAFEYVRAQLREGGGWQAFADGGREPWEPRLRRRWFRRPAERKHLS